MMQLFGLVVSFAIICCGVRAYRQGRQSEIEFRRVIGRRVVGGRWPQ